MLLILASPVDPIAIDFAVAAQATGLQVWRPTSLETFGFAFHLNCPGQVLEICDFSSDRCWIATDISGIFYKDNVLSKESYFVDGPDRHYAYAEMRSALRALLNGAPCPVVGQIPAGSPDAVFDSGVEARVALRRIGLSAQGDWIGPIANVHATFGDRDPCAVRIVPLDGRESFWLSEKGTKAAESGGFVAASAVDNPEACAVLHVDHERLVVGLSRAGEITVYSNSDFDQVERLAEAACGITRTRAGVTYCTRVGGRWTVSRLSPEVPSWLDAAAKDWMFSRLLRVFQAGREKPAEGSNG